MPLFELLLVIALLLVTLAGLALRWLWRQWGVSQLTPIRKAMMAVVFPGCLLALSLAGVVLRGAWLERPKPVTRDDLQILEKADALLKDESAWNRNDDRACDDDSATGKFSLFCALETACTEVLGQYDHRRAALQEVRIVVEEATQQRKFEHRLMDFNNLPETRFDDVKRVLRTSVQRVAARLGPPQPAAQQ
jgi:hypothetical protein